MAEILGLTVSDFPFLRMKPDNMPWVLHGNLAWGWRDKPHLRDSANWPQPMRDEWGSDQDQGRTAGARAQQSQIQQFRKLRTALDEFKPDVMLFLYRDSAETFSGEERPQFWIHSHEAVKVTPYNLWTFFRGNYFEEDPDRVDLFRGHPDAALHLADRLQKAGIVPRVVPAPIHPNGLGHNAIATAVHLDWDKQKYATPIIPLGIDPFRLGRTRNEEGLSPWDKKRSDTPLTPRQAFDLGREIARAYRDSPWRVAIVAGVDWSHANDSGVELERIHPDVEADQRRFAQWQAGDFTHWGDNWSFDEMETHAQWELLVTIVLAGAMSELHSKIQHAHFQPNWVCNDNFVTTIFKPS
ncbi:MAG TPA: hypothetical protein VIM43_03720 [Rugosibacter sp.]